MGIIPTLASYLLPLLLPDITKHHKNTVLIIEELQSDEIIARLQQDRLDLAFMSSPLDENDIREIPLFSEPFLLYLSVNHPLLRKEELVPDDLDPEDLLLLSEGHCFRNQALNLCNARGKSTRRGFYYESGSIETLKGLVDRKMGYTLVPELSVIEDLNAKPSIRRFKNPEPTREISLVCHERFSREKLLEVVRDIVQRNLPENLTRGKTYTRIPWK